MGIIICKKHGRRQMEFLSEGLYSLVNSKRTVRKIYKLTLDLGEDISNIFFIDTHSFDIATKMNLVANLLVEQEKIKPMCHLCFQDFLEKFSVTIIDKAYTIDAN